MTVTTGEVSPLARLTRAFETNALHDAVDALDQALAAGLATDDDAKVALAAARQLRDEDAALAAARQYLALAPDDLERRQLVMTCANAIGETEEAIAIARAIEADHPDDVKVKVSLANFCKQIGDFAEARAAAQRARAIAPDDRRVWRCVADIVGFTADDPGLKTFEDLAENAGEDLKGSAIAYAVGSAYDKVGDTDRAFAWFERGTRRAIGDETPPTDKLFADADGVRAAFTSERLVNAPPRPGPDDPILIAGFARSGTTLVERILATDPGVTAGGELNMLVLACLPITPPTAETLEPFIAAQGGEEAAWAKIADLYRRKLDVRFRGAPRVTNKHLMNFLYVGVFALAFPNAPIIHVRRDPMDVAWSCYHRRFGGNHFPWTYHFESMARFLRVYEDLMLHWRRLAPDRVHLLEYERLIADPETETARLFAFIGRERPSDWRDFHAKKASVRTDSVTQVREPLNAKGVGAWRRYERHLGPLRDALARQGLLEGRQPA